MNPGIIALLAGGVAVALLIASTVKGEEPGPGPGPGPGPTPQLISVGEPTIS